MSKQNISKRINYMFLILAILTCSILSINIENNYAFSKDDVTVRDDYSIKFNNTGEIKEPKDLLEKYQGLLVIFTTFITITLMGVFMLNIAKLAASADNPYGRRSAITSLIWSGVAIAIFGSASFWFGYFYFFMK